LFSLSLQICFSNVSLIIHKRDGYVPPKVRDHLIFSKLLLKWGYPETILFIQASRCSKETQPE
jgi:hypothetical protein